jgi:hypothetical protein
MFTKILVGGALAATVFAVHPRPQSPQMGTPAPMVATYDSLADAILAVKATESNLVRSLLASHYDAAQAAVQSGNYQKAAAEMALFANEGDNAVGGVRKRLLEGGHHHNAEGEAKGIYEPGYVIVTREAKQKALALSAEMRSAGDAATAQSLWGDFEKVAAPLMKAG